MYVISIYPRLIHPKYEKWFPKFPGNDVTTTKENMSNLWAYFQLNHVSDNAKYLVMKLFSATSTDVARRWYDSLPDKSIKNMDQLEETFLNKWSTKGDPIMLLT